MEIPITELRSIYADTIKEYNTSALAVVGKFIASAEEPKFLELVECVKHLPSKNATFLDIGTGKGIAPRFFLKLGCKSITIDNYVTGGDALRNAMEAGVTGVNCDITNTPLPLEDESVDCILFADVIEHLIHSPKYPLMEFRRVLKKGAVVVASTPNAMRLSVRLRVLLGYSNWPFVGDYFDASYHEGHHHEYTINEFKYVFTQSKFEILKFILTGTVATVNIGSLGDLQTRRRSGVSRASSTDFFISFAKIPIYILERVFSVLRPGMILVARKL